MSCFRSPGLAYGVGPHCTLARQGMLVVEPLWSLGLTFPATGSESGDDTHRTAPYSTVQGAHKQVTRDDVPWQAAQGVCSLAFLLAHVHMHACIINTQSRW